MGNNPTVIRSLSPRPRHTVPSIPICPAVYRNHQTKPYGELFPNTFFLIRIQCIHLPSNMQQRPYTQWQHRQNVRKENKTFHSVILFLQGNFMFHIKKMKIKWFIRIFSARIMFTFETYRGCGNTCNISYLGLASQNCTAHINKQISFVLLFLRWERQRWILTVAVKMLLFTFFQ